MRLQRCFLAFILILSYCNILFANNGHDRIKPKWLTQSLPESESGTYIFVRAHGQGSSLAGAKQMAFVAMSQRLEIERGLTVNTTVETRERLYQNQKESGGEYEQEIVLEVSEKGHQLEIVCREIDDYWVVSKGR